MVATDPEVEPVVGLLPVGTDEAAAPGALDANASNTREGGAS
jgi:hypothetical protein